MMKPWRYALGEIAFGVSGHAVGAYMLFYYTDHLGLAIGLAAVARTINAIWDGLNDPIFGHLSDRTRTRLGRRRPWLLWFAPIYLLMTVLAWTAPPGLRGVGLFWYFLAALLAFETTATIAWVNYNSLFPEVFPSPDQRLRANALRRVASFVSLLGGIAVAPLLYGSLGFVAMGLVLAAAGLLAAWGLLGGLREQPPPADQRGAPFLAALKGAMANRSYRFYLVAFASGMLANSILMSGMPFWAKYSLGLGDAQTSMLFGAVFLTALSGTAFWAWLGRRIGGLRAFAWAMAMYMVTVLPLGLARDLWTGLAAALPTGLGLAGMLVLQDVVLSAILDEDGARTGQRREGMFFGILSVFGRLSNVLQAGAFALLSVMFGYISGELPGPRPDAAFRFLMAAVTAVVLLVGWLAARSLHRDTGAVPAGQPGAAA